MALIPQEKLATDFWHHQCESKNNAVVYVPIGSSCFQCNKNQQQANGTVGTPQ